MRKYIQMLGFDRDRCLPVIERIFGCKFEQNESMAIVEKNIEGKTYEFNILYSNYYEEDPSISCLSLPKHDWICSVIIDPNKPGYFHNLILSFNKDNENPTIFVLIRNNDTESTPDLKRIELIAKIKNELSNYINQDIEQIDLEIGSDMNTDKLMEFILNN